MRVLELGVRDILNLDFSWFGIDDAAISTHDKPLFRLAGRIAFQRGADTGTTNAPGRVGT
jgi:hypothetical protein